MRYVLCFVLAISVYIGLNAICALLFTVMWGWPLRGWQGPIALLTVLLNAGATIAVSPLILDRWGPEWRK
jgi:hypothetical protein